MIHKKNALPVILATVLLSLSDGAHALTYSFLADSPDRYMKEDDYRILMDTAVDLLEKGKDGAKRGWKNPATKNSGIVQILLSYKDGDLNCRRTAMVSKTVKGMTEKSIVNLCKIDGEWKMKEWPAKAFNDEDWKLFDETAQDAMENVKDGGSRTWNNEKTGNSGTFKPLSTTKMGDRKCRTVNVSIATKNNQNSETTFTMCKNPDGSWKRAGAGQ